nr:MAG TPA: hypothetical protein [Caudoviricetes sp.]
MLPLCHLGHLQAVTPLIVDLTPSLQGWGKWT